MKKIKIIFIYISAVSIILSGCSTQPAHTSSLPLPFNEAIANLTMSLLTDVKNDAGIFGSLGGIDIAVEPFVDEASGNVVKVSREIEGSMITEANNRFHDMHLARMSKDQLGASDYVITGTVTTEKYGYTSDKKLYRVYSSALNKKIGTIVATKSIWIADTVLDYTPTPIYKDSPVYLKDKRVEGLINTSKKAPQDMADHEYYDRLETGALLNEASTAYDNENYGKAKTLYQIAATRPDGQLPTTYSGLYETNVKLNSETEADSAFTKLLDVSVKEKQRLNVKLLFTAGSIEFIEDPKIRQTYTRWLQLISKFLYSNQHCFHVVGHSSRSGAEEINRKLSFERATRVQGLTVENGYIDALQKSKAIGKGFAENIVGSGTDDIRDAIDRRVEFLIKSCQNL